MVYTDNLSSCAINAKSVFVRNIVIENFMIKYVPHAIQNLIKTIGIPVRIGNLLPARCMFVK